MKKISALALIILQSAVAREVDVFLAAGQSNAKLSWSNSIESTLNELRSEKEIRVVHSFHPGNWLNRWWNEIPQSNYTDNLAALETAFTEIEQAGKEPVFRGLFWFQGEGDSGSYSNMDLYKERFKSYVDQLKSDMSQATITTVIVAIDGNQDPFYDEPSNLAGRTRAQVEYMRNIHFELGVELDGFTVDSRDYIRGDAWHMTTSELQSLGQLIGEKYFLDYWAQKYAIQTSQIEVKNGSVFIHFDAPTGIENWTVYQSQDLHNWSIISRFEKEVTDSSEVEYKVEVSFDSSQSNFYRIGDPR
ncbi:MAG: sialate O-acetylesterase [Coraliomargarita sp.]